MVKMSGSGREEEDDEKEESKLERATSCWVKGVMRVVASVNDSMDKERLLVEDDDEEVVLLTEWKYGLRVFAVAVRFVGVVDDETSWSLCDESFCG